jgi:hypothetical protein
MKTQPYDMDRLIQIMSVAEKVRITSGIHDAQIPVAGLTLGEAKRAIGFLFDIPEDAPAYLRGKLSPDETLLAAGDHAEFMQPVRITEEQMGDGMIPKYEVELRKLLPADFDQPFVIRTGNLDAYRLLDPTSNESRRMQAWIDGCPADAQMFWRPPGRGWSTIVPHTGQVIGIRMGVWMVVGMEEWMASWKNLGSASLTPRPAASPG